MKGNPYFDPNLLLDMGREVTRRNRPSRWDMELDGFTENELGRTVRVPVLVATSAAAATSGFKWVARVTTKPEAARDWTITLGPLSPANKQGPFQNTDSLYEPPNISDAICLVQWSGGRQGAPSFALVDWWDGQQFSVFGSRVIVSGAVLVLATAAVAVNNTHVLSGQLAPGLSRNAPRRTIILPPNIASGGGTAAVAVPPFARNVSFSLASLTGFGATDISMTGELISGGTTIWQQFPLSLGGNFQSEIASIRLPIGTNFIRITNNDNNTDILQARLLFDLALS